MCGVTRLRRNSIAVDLIASGHKILTVDIRSDRRTTMVPDTQDKRVYSYSPADIRLNHKNVRENECGK